MNVFMEAVMPQLVLLISAVLTALLGWLTTMVREKWNIEIEAKHRDALHSAIMTGVLVALKQNLTGPAAVSVALDHVKKSVPDALKKLGPSTEILTNLAKSKIEELSLPPVLTNVVKSL